MTTIYTVQAISTNNVLVYDEFFEKVYPAIEHARHIHEGNGRVHDIPDIDIIRVIDDSGNVYFLKFFKHAARVEGLQAKFDHVARTDLFSLRVPEDIDNNCLLVHTRVHSGNYSIADIRNILAEMENIQSAIGYNESCKSPKIV